MKKSSSLGIHIAFLFAIIGLILIRCDGKNKVNRSNWQTAEVVRRDVGSSVLATGIVKPMTGAEVRVGSRVSGIVKNLYANIGDIVKKDQLLAELNPTENQAKYNQIKAALDNS